MSLSLRPRENKHKGLQLIPKQQFTAQTVSLIPSAPWEMVTVIKKLFWFKERTPSGLYCYIMCLCTLGSTNHIYRRLPWRKGTDSDMTQGLKEKRLYDYSR